MPNTSAQQYLRAVLALAATALVVLSPARAEAQGFISPFIGFDYGGDSGCPTASDCEDKHSNIGVSGGKLAALGGVEVEFNYARNFFGDTPGISANVLTLMTNVIAGPKVGPVRPFVLGGLGLIKTRAEFTGESLFDTSTNNFGWNLGGGLMVMFGDHIGVRGDLRRFKSFGDHGILGFSLSHEKLTFNRATAGLVLAF